MGRSLDVDVPNVRTNARTDPNVGTDPTTIRSQNIGNIPVAANADLKLTGKTNDGADIEYNKGDIEAINNLDSYKDIAKSLDSNEKMRLCIALGPERLKAIREQGLSAEQLRDTDTPSEVIDVIAQKYYTSDFPEIYDFLSTLSTNDLKVLQEKFRSFDVDSTLVDNNLTKAIGNLGFRSKGYNLGELPTMKKIKNYLAAVGVLVGGVSVVIYLVDENEQAAELKKYCRECCDENYELIDTRNCFNQKIETLMKQENSGVDASDLWDYTESFEGKSCEEQIRENLETEARNEEIAEENRAIQDAWRDSWRKMMLKLAGVEEEEPEPEAEAEAEAEAEVEEDAEAEAEAEADNETEIDETCRQRCYVACESQFVTALEILEQLGRETADTTRDLVNLAGDSAETGIGIGQQFNDLLQNYGHYILIFFFVLVILNILTKK